MNKITEHTVLGKAISRLDIGERSYSAWRPSRT
jgi:hypothetical protein